jgi:uncharacterized DUF497 family protein
MAFYLAFAQHGQMAKTRFEWDATKDRENQLRHGVSFTMAQFAFADPRRVIALDTSHSTDVFGAGYWRKGKRIYERENQVHR